MLLEVRDLDYGQIPNGVPDHESGLREFVEGSVNVVVVVWEDGGLDALRAVFETSPDVRQAPQPDEQEAGQRVEFSQLVVGPERWLDGSDSHEVCEGSMGCVAGVAIFPKSASGTSFLMSDQSWLL